MCNVSKLKKARINQKYCTLKLKLQQKMKTTFDGFIIRQDID